MNEDGELQDKELTRLYREAAREQPSAELDARMLAAARAAARPPAAPAANSWISSWRIPVALAAVVLLSFTLTLLVREGEEVRPPAPDQAVATPGTPHSKTEAAPALVAPIRPALPGAKRPAAEPRQLPPRDAGPAPRDASAPAAAGRSPESADAPAPKLDVFAPEPAAGTAANLARERKAMQAAPSAAAGDELRSRVMTDRQQEETARPEAFAAPPAPLAAPSPALRGQLAPAPVPGRAGMAEKAARSPEQWLAEIRRLKRAGKAAEAETSLAEFRKRYPQYSLPEDLK